MGDQYEKAKNVATAPTIQITMPSISVPPAQVIVAPGTPPQESQDLTGFLELAKSDMVTSIVAEDSPISVNVGFIVKGTQPIDGAAYITSDILADYDKKLDSEVEKTAEQEIGKIFSKEIEKAKAQMVREKFKGHKLGVGNGIVWSTQTHRH